MKIRRNAAFIISLAYAVVGLLLTVRILSPPEEKMAYSKQGAEVKTEQETKQVEEIQGTWENPEETIQEEAYCPFDFAFQVPEEYSKEDK